MTDQQRKDCHGCIDRAITHIARFVGCKRDDVIDVFKDFMP